MIVLKLPQYNFIQGFKLHFLNGMHLSNEEFKLILDKNTAFSKIT